jgi:hypothetical protein
MEDGEMPTTIILHKPEDKRRIDRSKANCMDLILTQNSWE